MNIILNHRRLGVFCRLTLVSCAYAVIIGTLPLLWLARLPSFRVSLLILIMSCALWVTRQTCCQWIAIVLCIFVWSTWNANKELVATERFLASQAQVIGTVQSADIGQLGARRILVKVERVNEHSLPFWQHFILSLRLPESETRLAAGQRWQFTTSMRPVHGRFNEGGFDKARWAMSNHISIEGTIRQQQKLNDSLNLRQRLIDKTREQITGYSGADIMLALAFGERGLMSETRKTQLIATGTAHLMAISGLHVALASLLGTFFARCCQFFLPLRWIEPHFPLVFGWAIAAGYVWLSGANPPALRAFLAVTLWLILRSRQQQWRPWQCWFFIVATLLIWDPLMVLSSSFWLSSLAVAALILMAQWSRHSVAGTSSMVRKIRRLCGLQIGLMILLAPLQIMLFHGLSWSSLPANLIAIPMISFLTVPCIFLGLLTIFSPMSALFWFLADLSIQCVFFVLSRLSGGWLQTSMTIMLFSAVSWLAVVSWKTRAWRYFLPTLVVLIIVGILPYWQGAAYRWRVDFLDVGHGLAVLIRDEDRAILYDTGAAWSGGSAAEWDILPYLSWQQLSLDGVIISHQDNDHSGGLPILREAFPASWLKSSDLSLSNQGCLTGQSWQWHRLRFEILAPDELVWRTQNADSCVVRVSDGRFSVLLTGDIGKQQEAKLVEQYRDKLQATILQVPHHGSKTSSSSLFLRTVKPEVAISTNARFSPWVLPNPQVVARYHQAEIPWYSTAQKGQVSVVFYDAHYVVQAQRDNVKRWYHR